MKNLIKAQVICTDLEARLRPFGLHVAITGSTLYGHPGTIPPAAKNDIDIIIYAGTILMFERLTDENSRRLIEGILTGAGCCVTHPFHQGDAEYSDIPSRWFCQTHLNGERVDFILLH